MKLITVFLLSLILAVAVSASAADMSGFRGFLWGADVESMREEDSKLVEGRMGVMPGVKAFQRSEEDLGYGGIKADSITYTYYKEKFTGVVIDFHGFDNYEKLLIHCKKMFGPVTGAAVLRLEQYTSFDTKNTGVMLLYQLSQQSGNFGKLYLYSKEFLNK
ncbi:MAG: hypothetical protein HXX11_13310 [Desulfuromonadales bacterium]|nr:hypothetical protein [Desulfuromonadales bacterium]